MDTLNSSSKGRIKSGWKRDFRLPEVIAINVLGYSIGLAFCTSSGYILTSSPNVSLPLAIFLGALIAVVCGYAYGLLAGLMPSTGGDYNYVSRAVHPSAGYLSSWGFTFANLFGLAVNLSFFHTAGAGPALISISNSFGVPQFAAAGTYLQTPNGALFGGLTLLLLITAIALLGRPMSRLVLYPLVILASSGSLAMLFVLVQGSQSEFRSAFDTFMGQPGTYDAVVALGSGNGGSSNSGTLKAITFASAAAAPLGFLCFVGFNYSVYFGGEVSEPQHNQRRGIIFGIVFGVVMLTSLMYFYERVVGGDFVRGLAAAESTNMPAIAAKGVTKLNSALFVGLLATPSLNAFIQVTNLLWFFAVTGVILQVCARNFMAWSLDYMFFDSMRRRLRNQSPWVAIVLAASVSALLLVLNTYAGFNLAGAAVVLAVPMFLTGIAAVSLAIFRRDLVAPERTALTLQPPGAFALVASGILAMVGAAWLALACLLPELGDNGSGVGLVTSYLLAVYGAGFLMYLVFRSKKVRELGEDLDEELPDD
jgi:amino acid transporter